eukprot:TRINITY_DN27827_c0_g1_i1.p1 TRINITY_DN27827_c0_g1~~TRINITY_DN27827_c0_g1_i1.p1  ORF type:complete len:642 (-),score=88.43 TRINITY_DN27827_c0_g1_i1:298-2223(-)
MDPDCVPSEDSYRNSSRAWDAAVGATGANLSQSSWRPDDWPMYFPCCNFSMPSSAGGFTLMDINGDSSISRQEFDDLFNLCQIKSTPSSSSSSGPSQNTSSSMPGQHDTTSISPATSSASSHVDRTSAMLSTLSTTLVMSPSNCCHEMSATCLSCISGITVEAFCAQQAMSATPGCKTAPFGSRTAAAPGGLNMHAKSTTGGPSKEISTNGSAAHADSLAGDASCPLEAVAYAPLLPGHNRSTEEMLASCQARCARTLGCAHFTFWKSSRGCELHSITASWFRAPLALGGPPSCIARFWARVASVEFRKLTDSKLHSLQRGIAQAIANFANVSSKSVHDLNGNVGVSLSAGSLIVESDIVLPLGGSVSEVATKAAQPSDLQRRISDLMLDAKVPLPLPTNVTAGFQAVFPMSIAVNAATDCFLAGTGYTSHGEQQSSKNATAEQGAVFFASKCQEQCAKAADCAVFTFWPAESRCQLLGEDAIPVRNKLATSGPRACHLVPSASERGLPGFSLPGLGTVEPQYMLAQVQHLPWYWLALILCVITVGLIMLGLWLCHGKRGRYPDVGKTSSGQALYLPISSKDEDEGSSVEQAREIRSRGLPGNHAPIHSDSDGPAAHGVPDSPPACAFAFHGPDVLSWRKN